MPEEQNVVACCRVRPGLVPVARSTVAECCECGHAVWQSPASKIVAQENNCILKCAECSMDMIGQGEYIKVQPMTQAQIQEFTDYYRPFLPEHN
jgi:hypothetical protein